MVLALEPRFSAIVGTAGGAFPSGDELESVLVGIWDAARAAWPDLSLAVEPFIDAIARHALVEGAGYLSELHGDDVYLAVACAAGDRAAIGRFDEIMRPHAVAALARFRLPAAVGDEIWQAVSVDLLVAEPGAAPKIATFTGRGELASFVRVCATRAALRRLRTEGRAAPFVEVDLDGVPAGLHDPEIAHLKAVYGRELHDALVVAIASLEPRQRNLLRQHILDELSIDDLGRLYRVHRATAARWLGEARAQVASVTRKRLVERLRLRPSELESILRFLESDIELGVSGLLASQGTG